MESNYGHEIDTGTIYLSFEDNWKKLPRELVPEMEKKLEIILSDKFVLTNPILFKKKDIKTNIEKLKHLKERAKINGNPPFTYYFVQAGPDDLDEIIGYRSSQLLSYEKDNEYFDFFFMLKLISTNEMKLIEFLEFQVLENFDNDFNKYVDFLELLLIKYNEFIKRGKIDKVVKKYIAKSPQTKERSNSLPMREEERTKKVPVTWTNEKNKTDFVKIIYALHSAKLINNGESDVTKLVEYLADVFNVELASTWQSNLSKSRNNKKEGYNPSEIFDRLKVAYDAYQNKAKKQ